MLHNVNELLEMKKSLEIKLGELANIRKEELLYVTVKTIDYTNEKNNRDFEIRPRIAMSNFVTEYINASNELSKIKTAIQKHNADILSGKICERESLRRKISYFGMLKTLTEREKQSKREVTRKDANQTTLETQETTFEPMFLRKEIEKMVNEFAIQERKINTEIQRLNLEKTIEL